MANLSQVARSKDNFKFGRCDLFYYDETLLKYVLWGHTQDTTVEITWEEVPLLGGPGDALLDSERRQVAVNVTAQLLEVSMANLIRVLPSEFSSLSTGATLESYEEVKTLVGTTAVDLRFTNIEDTDPAPIVLPLGGGAAFTADSGTFAMPANDGDYVINFTTGEIKRVTGSTIGDGDRVTVQYQYVDALAKKINVGSRACTLAGTTFNRLRGIAKGRKCNYFGFEVYKAKTLAPITIPFQNQFTTLEAKFQGIVDESLPPGFDLMELIEGSAAQI